MPGRKLKVFQTRIGFHDIVVASASRAGALRAWGTRRDLFAQGLAEIVSDPSVIELALAQPETPLRRPAGSSDPFTVDPGRPKIAEIDPGAESNGGSGKRPKPPPDRSKLDAAEATLARVNEDYKRDLASIQAQLKALDKEELALRARRTSLGKDAMTREKEWRQRRSKAEQAVERERKAYRKDGGKS